VSEWLDEQVDFRTAIGANGDEPDDDPEPQPAGDVAAGSSFRAVPLSAFLSADDEIPEPLVGDDDTRMLTPGSTLVFYGEGGSSKTTLLVDLAYHLAAGVDWIGFPIGRAVNVLILEDEGPKAEFQRKLRRKRDSWPHGDVDGRVFVHSEPWASIDLRRDQHVEGLAAELDAHQVDVLIAGPIRRLGLDGGGTPAETVAFMGLLGRVRDVARLPVAIVCAHHENKGGDISGAFEAEFDTVVHVKPDGRDRTQLSFRKARWSSKIHRSRATLAWTAGEGFELVESDLDEDRTAAARDAAELDALNWIANYVADHYTTTGAGVPSNTAADAYHQAHGGHGRNLARRVIEREVQLAGCWFDTDRTGENPPVLATTTGERRHGKYLIPFSHALSPLAATPNGETGDNPPPAHPGDTSRHLAAAYREGGEWREGGEGHDQDETERLADIARSAAPDAELSDRR
jgi:AAA domain